MRFIRRSIPISEDGGRIFREISECQDHCSGCPLEGKQDPVGPIGVVRGKSQYAFVTGVPFTNEHGGDGISLLRPPAWSLLRKSLEKNDIRWDRKDYAVVPSVRCSFDAKNTPNKEIKNIQNHCVGWLEQDLSEIKPSVIVPLGAIAASQVMGRSVKITKARGVLAKRNDGTNVFPTIDPTSCIAYPQSTPVFVADIETFRRLLDNSMDQEAASSTSLVEYEVVHDLRFILQDNPPILSFDTEATSLSWFKKGEDPRKFRRGITPDDFVARAAVLTMQFSYEAGKAYVLPWDHPDDPMSYKDKPKILVQLQRVLSKSKIVTQNGKFDRVYLRNVLGVDFPIAGDTFMLATLLDENALERNLDILMKLYVPEMAGYNDYYNSIMNKEKMWAEPLERIVPYGGGDADAVFRLHQVLYRKVAEDPRLLDHYKHVTLPGLNALAYMESRGSYIDESKLEKFEQDTTKYVNELEQHLLAQVPDSIKRAHIDKGLKFSRPDFKLDILFRHPDGFRLKPQVFTKGSQGLPPKEKVPSTSSKDHLPFFFDECSFAEDLAIYIKAERMLNTSVIGFKKKYIVDGMVRPSYSLGTVVTGRTSSSEPNGQNYPVRGGLAEAYKECFIAPEGYAIVAADLSQIELRIAAELANERTMLRIFLEGGDIHEITCMEVMGISKEQLNAMSSSDRKFVRFGAKAVNFGYLFGMFWKKFRRYAKTQYGVDYTDQEAEHLMKGYFKTYPGLHSWHKNVKSIVRRDKQVRSLTGRIRHLPAVDSSEDYIRQEAERFGINAPVQETGSSLGVMATAAITNDIDEKYLAVFSFIHDAIYALVPEQYALWGARKLKAYMEFDYLKANFGYNKQVPIVSVPSIGFDMNNVVELEDLSPDGEYDLVAKGLELPVQEIPPDDGLRNTDAGIYSWTEEFHLNALNRSRNLV